MTTHTLQVSRSQSRHGFLFHPIKSLSDSFAAWAARRRHRADLALLMSMEPHLRDDIGVSLAEPSRGEAKVLNFHPAVLATTMNALHGPNGR